MGMSTHIIGFKPPDEKWHKMKQVYDSCNNAGIEVPYEVDDFFEGLAPDEAGVEIDLEESDFVKEWSDDSRSGFEIDVSRLPKDVKLIRFYISW